MAEKFPGSGLLIQDCDGHGFNAAPSKCRENVLRKYFATGEVSQTVTECGVNRKPFEEILDDDEGGGSFSRNFMVWRR